MSDPTIHVRNVEKSYGTVTALDGASLRVDRGETLGLVGRNGAGKTTLFKLLVGHERPDAGDVTVAGLSPEAGTALRERVGYLPESAGFPPSLTGREVLSFHARVRGVPTDERARRVERVLRTVGLADAADRAVGGYSNGMNRRLGLATALVGDPAVLLLDEPTAGLDPAGVADFHAVVDALASETDVSILVTSHVLPEIERLCDRVAVLEGGRVTVAGGVDDLRQSVSATVTIEATLGDETSLGDEAAFDAEAASAAETLSAADAMSGPDETAASDERSVDEPSVAGSPADVATEVGNLDGVESATVDGRAVRVECTRDVVFDVLDALRAVGVETVEVTEPGLDAVFREQTGTGGDAGEQGDGGARAVAVNGGERA